MDKTTLLIRTIVMCPNPKKVTLLTRHNLTRAEASDIAVEFEGQNPHLQLQATFLTEETWML